MPRPCTNNDWAIVVSSAPNPSRNGLYHPIPRATSSNVFFKKKLVYRTIHTQAVLYFSNVFLVQVASCVSVIMLTMFVLSCQG